MERLTNCIVKIRNWMASNRLKLNEDKTQVIWLGTRHQLSKLTENTLTLPNATVQFSTVVNDLGVQIDSQLSMSNHIAKLSRSCFFHLRQLRLIRQSLTPEAMNTLVQSFITNRLDSCNSVLIGVNSQLLQRMQVIQNAAARFITGARRFEHMTPVLRDLHWLPVRQRIKFKTAVLVYKCLHGMAPPYLTSYCTPVSAQTGRSNLRSATTGQLVVPRTRTVYGSRSFAVHGPVVWNSLPAELRSPDMTLGVFRKQLKTHLFNCQ